MMLSRISLLVSCLILFAQLVACTFDWSVYPSCAQPALQNNAPESCDYGSDEVDITLTDDCLCSDNGFIESAASEIYTSCGCEILTTSADLMNTACSEYAPGFLQLTVAEIIYAGDGGQSVCGYKSAASTSASIAAATSSSTAPASTQSTSPSTGSASAPTTASAPSSNNNNGGGGGGSNLGVGGIIGIVAGICTIIGTIVTIWMCCRRRRYVLLGK
jgi:hypothetical protein